MSHIVCATTLRTNDTTHQLKGLRKVFIDNYVVIRFVTMDFLMASPMKSLENGLLTVLFAVF